MSISTLHAPTTRHSLNGLRPFLLFLVSLMSLLSLLGPSNLYAAGVSLTWNKNNESDLAGYKVYKRLLSTNEYGSPVFSGRPSNPFAPKVTINNLQAGTSYKFIATTFDSSGNESGPSREIQVTTSGSRGGSSRGSSSSSGGISGGSSSSGSNSTGAFPAAMASPPPGTTLRSTTITFTGGHTSQDASHRLYVGTRKGAKNLYSGTMAGHRHTRTVKRLPRTGTIYVRYWTRKRGKATWFFKDHTYTMAVGSSGGGSTSGSSSSGGSNSSGSSGGTTTQGGGGSALIDQSGWRLHYVDSEELVGENGAATNAFDGKPGTLWHTQWSGNPDPPHPHDLQVNLGAVYQVDGIRYLPRQDGGTKGRIGRYEVYVPRNSGTPPTTPPRLSQWRKVASGTFPNSAAEQEVRFAGVTSRYVWLRALSEAPGTKPFTTVGELKVRGKVAP